MLVAGRAPDDVTCANLHDRFALAFGPAAAGSNDEGLSQGMGVADRAPGSKVTLATDTRGFS
jgi:hypothetical protein